MERLIHIVKLFAVGFVLISCSSESEQKPHVEQKRLKDAEWVLDRCTFSYKGKNIWFGDPPDSLRAVLGKESIVKETGNKSLIYDEIGIEGLFQNDSLFEVRFRFMDAKKRPTLKRFNQNIFLQSLLLTPETAKDIVKDNYGHYSRNSNRTFDIYKDWVFSSYAFWDDENGVDFLGVWWNLNDQNNINHRELADVLGDKCDEPTSKSTEEKSSLFDLIKYIANFQEEVKKIEEEARKDSLIDLELEKRNSD